MDENINKDNENFSNDNNYSNNLNEDEIIFNNYIDNYSNYLNSNGISALDLLIKDRDGNNNIITFCSEIDQMLNGGIPLKKITEISGVPGIGKTQMAFQLLVNTSIPFDLGGVQGKAIYIDTEGSYSCHRVREIATHLVDHLECVLLKNPRIEYKPTVETILNSIYYYRVYHYIEIISLIHQLPLFLEKNKDVKLIVVDSITYPFRSDFKDMGLRTRSLLSLAQNLMNMATRYNLAVVVMNQVTTKISPNQKESILVPYLGESWTHICTYRMVLFWKQKQRFCHLYKSPSNKSCFNPFDIAEYGIRDVGFIHPSFLNPEGQSQNKQQQQKQQPPNNNNDENEMYIET
ncbi:hypothetical protein RB653_001101 [Dictyostelium firmibasis]|uniref:DNA repair protein RAD51 homolog 3 n=1 Tax=Dictyostelium firmibasis TaxID=79012 RepID=A0AAN7UG76_9MYCE